MSNHNILVYGFRPYGPYKRNITEEAIACLPRIPGVTRHVFDVRFDARMFDEYFCRIAPDIIIGMGQHPRARKLRIERKSINAMKSPDGMRQPIERSGPATRFTTLDLPMNRAATLTYNAGDYVCNYSMYMAAKYCHVTGGRFGFLHVPRDYPGDGLVDYLVSLINTLNPRDRAAPDTQ